METKRKILTTVLEDADIDKEFINSTYRKIATEIGYAILEQNGALFYITDKLVQVGEDEYVEGKMVKVMFEYVITDPKKVLKEDMMKLIK